MWSALRLSPLATPPEIKHLECAASASGCQSRSPGARAAARGWHAAAGRWARSSARLF